MKVSSIVLLMASLLFLSAKSKPDSKKVQSFVVSKELNISADKVWAVVGEDYGAISRSHPKIVHSELINGTVEACEGAERVCNFNEKGTQYLKEKMIDYDPDNMQFTNQVYQAGRFPVDPEYTEAVYSVKDLGNGKSMLSFDMQYRTKPSFMGGMMKGKFKKLIEDYFIAVEHYALTSENVTKENFKAIKKQYK